jgi:2-keto-4-pentenoate hydratase/2-oxohepta-3-ene-1,7-dioic acid hydratase in catechol pathway
MQLMTYASETGPRLGARWNDQLLDLGLLAAARGLTLPASMLELIDAGPDGLAKVVHVLQSATEADKAKARLEPEGLRWMAPIPKPRKNIFGIGLNYTEHVAESARTLDTSKDLPQQPVIFSKPPTAVTGPFDPILHNQSLTRQLDHEVELAVIIGKGGKNIRKESALDHVFGYTVINDVSARDCRRAGQWIVSKGQDSFAPMGPFLITRDEIADPHNLNLSLKLNEIEKQNSNTRFMLFRIPDLIADLSTVFTLEPGDIIATGTPAGVGAGKNPPEWMWPGDVVECTVEGIGTLRNPVVEVFPAT